MGGLRALSHDDYDRALAFVASAASADGAEPFETPVIDGLLGLIKADAAGYYEFTEGQSRPRNTFHTRLSDGLPEIDWAAPEVIATADSWPLLDARAKRCDQVLRLSDFLSGRELQRNAWYGEVQSPRGVVEEMKGWIRAPLGVTRAFYFVRTTGATFTERDRAVLTLLLRHLSSIRERWQLRHQPETLTARENQVLAFVAAGYSNAEIAAELFLSPSTVRTHLEHIFQKLDVHSRTAAVAWRQTPR